jgi:hypothetical protein
MNFASLTPGQMHKESKTMALRLNLFNQFNYGEGLSVPCL